MYSIVRENHNHTNNCIVNLNDESGYCVIDGGELSKEEVVYFLDKMKSFYDINGSTYSIIDQKISDFNS